MTSPSLRGASQSLDPRIAALVMGDFAMGRELFANSPMRGIWLHVKTTQHNAMSKIWATERRISIDVTPWYIDASG